MNDSLNRQLKSAILRSVNGKYLVYLVQLISLILLSRLFSPELFGIVASMQVVMLFFQLIANSAVAPAIVYQEFLSEKDRDGIFSVSIIVSLLLSITVFFLSDIFFQFIDIEHDNSFKYLLSFAVVFTCISMMPSATLQKDTQFSQMAKSEIIAEIIAVISCLIMLQLNFLVHALFIKFTTVPFVRFFCYMFFSQYSSIGRPRFGSHLTAIYPLLSFIKYQMMFNVVNFFSRNLDTILITKFFGPTAIGFYDKSYQLMRYPLQLFTFAINPALQPILTNYKNDPYIVKNEYYSVTLKLAYCGIFVSFVFYYCSSDILAILFGKQWLPGSQILSILAVSIPLQMVLSSTGGVFQAFGQAQKQFHCGLFSSFTNITAILWGIFAGDVNLLCIALVFTMLVNFLQCFYVLNRYVFKVLWTSELPLLLLLVFIPYINLFIQIDLNTNFISLTSSLYKILFFSFALFAIQLLMFFISKKLFTFNKDC